VTGYAVFLRVGVSPDYPAVILPAVVLIGVAFGLGFSSLSLAATAGIADGEQGLAASLFQTSFQVGGAIVLAIVTAVVDAGGASRITTAQATLGAYRPALAVITAISALGALTALSGLLPARRKPAGRLAPEPALALAVDTATDTAAAAESDDCADPICA
jgi:sugar phosphate permease